MKKITVGFSSGHGPLVWLIKKAEKSPFSHAYIKFYSASLDRVLVYQASGLAVNFMGPDVFKTKAIVYQEFELEVSDEAYKKCIQFAIDKSGVGYGAKQLVGMGLVKLCSMFGRKIKNPFADGGSTYVCSELVFHLLNDIADISITDFDPESDGPMELYSQISKIAKTPNL